MQGFQAVAAAAQERQKFFCTINDVVEPVAAIGHLVQHNVTFAGYTVELTTYRRAPTSRFVALSLPRCDCVITVLALYAYRG